MATGQLLGRLGWLDGCRNIVDLGGGSGRLAVALQRHLPGTRVRVLERPAVAPVTRRFVAAEGGHVEVVEGELIEKRLARRRPRRPARYQNVKVVF
ncbi:MAG TPA: methyltransferase [Candidatus Latescibacteria bacterium]|nr:methyltransferase [Candidatus Latescibacterota bacterium]HJP29254.1 methyltransferase [Candidatus Latescibacterota bacterium]